MFHARTSRVPSAPVPPFSTYRPARARLALCAALLGLAAALAPLGARPAGAQGRVPSSCTAVITSTLSPAAVRMCDPVDVTTTLTTGCPACPDGMNVVFIQEDTPHDDWQKQVSLQALSELERYARRGRDISVGVIHYNGQGVRQVLQPTLGLGAARGALTSFNVAHDPRGVFLDAARAGVQMVRRGRQLHGDRATPECEFIIFFVYTKVYMADKGQEMIQAGRMLLREVDNLFVGCPHQHPEECTIWEPQVPESQRFYTEDPEPSKLRTMVGDALHEIDTKGVVKLRTLTVDQWLPPGLELVPGSFNLVPSKTMVDGGRTKLTWGWRLPKAGAPITLTYKARPKLPGQWQTDMSVTLTDSENRRRIQQPITNTVVIQDDYCLPAAPTPTPTPAPTETPVPTPTRTPPPTYTPTPTPTPSATATPEPTATPRPKPIYLPVLVGESCDYRVVHADVVLVLDISTSMNRPSRTGRTKLAATLEAAKAFVALMDLTPDDRGASDQVAVVGFNKTAWIQAPLGHDAARIARAIDDLAQGQAEHTRLDLALDVGADAIRTGARKAANTPVVILLTDGLPNRVPPAEDGTMETTVLRAAERARAAGITVYTIAIGAAEDTNPVLLRACASDPDHYLYTPDPEDLGGIYRSIAFSIGCPPDAFWGGR